MDPADIQHETSDPFVPKPSHELQWQEVVQQMDQLKKKLQLLQPSSPALAAIKEIELDVDRLYAVIYAAPYGGIELVEKVFILKDKIHQMLQILKANLLDKQEASHQLLMLQNDLDELKQRSPFKRKSF